VSLYWSHGSGASHWATNLRRDHRLRPFLRPHHMTAAHSRGRRGDTGMSQALHDSELRPEDVSYISAHGTGTLTNDRLETWPSASVQGCRLFHSFSSIKSMLGHTMGPRLLSKLQPAPWQFLRSHPPPSI